MTTAMTNGHPAISQSEDLQREIAELRGQLAESHESRDRLEVALTESQGDLEMAQSDLTHYRGHVAELQGQVAAEVQTRQNFEADLKATNEFLNGVAKRREWCGEYESYMEQLNDQLASGFRFERRTSSYSVTVRMTAKFDRIITVEAIDDDRARNAVYDMTTRERYRAALGSLGVSLYGESFDDEFEIVDVNRNEE